MKADDADQDKQKDQKKGFGHSIFILHQYHRADKNGGFIPLSPPGARNCTFQGDGLRSIQS